MKDFLGAALEKAKENSYNSYDAKIDEIYRKLESSSLTNPNASQTVAESNPDYADYFSKLIELEGSNVQKQIEAERANSQALMEANALEAEKQRQFAQSSAREEMAFTKEMQEYSAKINAEEAEKTRAFSKEMSDTAFQRATDDLKKAGLNPILAVGAQASTPNSAAASIGSVQGASAEGSFASGVKANAGKSDISSLFSSIAQVYTSMSNVSAQLYNTDVMSATQRATANKNMVSSLFNAVSSIFGINWIKKK